MQFNVKQPQKKFNPITVELTFESQEELDWFYWITNMSSLQAEEHNGIDIEPAKYGQVQMGLYHFHVTYILNILFKGAYYV